MQDIPTPGAAPIARRRFLGLTAATGVGLTLGAGPIGASLASAAAPPTIHPTSSWGAVPPSSAVEMLNQAPKKLFIHHTATGNSTDYSLAHGQALARSIQRDHMNRGWIDSGQQFTLTRGGHALEGRHRSLEALRNGRVHVQGAHCTAQNDVAVGIENEGNYMTVDMRAEHYAVLVDFSTYICSQFGIRAYQIYGHRNFNATDCPGDRLYAMLPRLRSDVAARIGGDPTPPAWPTLRRGDRAERVKALQYLLRSRGATIEVDGDFGAATEAAVRDFQGRTKASSDGVAGSQTWNQLAWYLTRGASGEAVKAVQNQLVANGISVAVDGAFGPGTETGVKTFQNRVSLTADGIVDPRTLSRLLA
ncbi:N-acetylmuramoyl-L-alanine amidase [Micromonospora sp. NPDC049679]|uniref:peptidoglycan recognition protein family protein n=1 Tax=Micromonospora sp. NPDC049679 TaxID=3155920 RepID=UPI0033E7F9DD